MRKTLQYLYHGKRKELPDSLPDMSQEDTILVLKMQPSQISVVVEAIISNREVTVSKPKKAHSGNRK